MDRIPKNQSTRAKKSAPETSLVFMEFLTFFMNSFWLSAKGLKEIEVEVGQWVIDLFGSRFADFMMNSSTSVDQKPSKFQGKATREKYIQSNIPRKTSMEPENGPLEKDIRFGNHHVQVPCSSSL